MLTIHIIAPPRAIKNHRKTTLFQPMLPESLAIPYVDIALPMYVLAFKTPDTVDTFPCALKNGGIIQIRIRFTPCIQPVNNADSNTDPMALVPFKKNNPSAANAPTAKIIAAQVTGLFSLPPYIWEATWKLAIPNSGNKTPDKMEAPLLK